MKTENILLRKKAVSLVILALFSVASRAQYTTEFLLTDLDNASLKEQVQQTIGKLLTECNMAYAENRKPDFATLNMSFTTQMCIEQLWESTPFRAGDTEIVERCLNTYDKTYQVRNIPLFLKGGEQDDYQEAVIGFDAKGTLTDFHLAIENNLYIKVLKRGSDVTDFTRRQMILDYVEQFRTAYNTKDINFLQQVFSDDALIITGKVIKTVPSEMNNFLASEKVKYVQQDKKQYLTNLESIFRRNKRIHVVFDDLKVMKHPAKEGFYGVTLKQNYSSDSYSDEGYLFLLWDFNNPDAPQIHVRTWQPYWMDQGKTQRLPEEDVFTINDFSIM